MLKKILENQFIGGVIFLLFLLFLFEIKGILISIFISYIIMASVYPFVAYLTKRKMPKTMAVFTAYILLLVLIIMLIFPLFPFLISQVQTFLNKLPDFLLFFKREYNINIDVNQIKNLISQESEFISRNIFQATSKVFGGIFSFLTVFVISLYLLLDHDRIQEFLIRLFPKQSEEKSRRLILQIEEKLGAWLRGQIVLSFFIGILTWLALTILGIEYALPLAVIAGILEIVPTLGPILSAIPAILVALTLSPAAALFVVGAYSIIQLLENNIIVPKVMQKAVGLNPAAIIIAILIGGKLFGILGSLLSIPFVSMVLTIIDYIKSGNKS